MTASNRKFIIFTWGCQMNDDDADQIAGLLMQMGYSSTDIQEEADLAGYQLQLSRTSGEDSRLLQENGPEKAPGKTKGFPLFWLWEDFYFLYLHSFFISCCQRASSSM